MKKRQFGLMTFVEVVLVLGATMGYMVSASYQDSRRVIQFDQLPATDTLAQQWLEENTPFDRVAITRDGNRLETKGRISVWNLYNQPLPEPPWERLGYRNPSYLELSYGFNVSWWGLIPLLIAVYVIKFVIRRLSVARQEPPDTDGWMGDGDGENLRSGSVEE